MPVYIVHGFRWPRAGMAGIRVYIIIQNLDDAAAEYIQAPATSASLLASFRASHPDLMKHLPNLQFVEQYDPEDLTSETAVSQPFAFVADKVVTMGGAVGSGVPGDGGLSQNLEDVISEGHGLSAAGWDALADLRDQIAPGERIGWWVVYNGDPERKFPGMDEAAGESGYGSDEMELNELVSGGGDEDDDVETVTERMANMPAPPPIPPEKKSIVGRKMDGVLDKVKGDPTPSSSGGGKLKKRKSFWRKGA